MHRITDKKKKLYRVHDIMTASNEFFAEQTTLDDQINKQWTIYTLDYIYKGVIKNKN